MRMIDAVRRLCPRAHPIYIEAFEKADDDLEAAGINTKLRMAHFLTQVMHETGRLTILTENMNYSARRMTEVWPRRFPTTAHAAPYANNPKALAEKTYGGRMGNGPEGSGDGWKYIGRGPIQCTGKESYAEFGKLLGIDLVGNPELAIDPDYTLKIAIAEWTQKRCNPKADQNDIYAISLAINGGTVGLVERRSMFTEVWKIFSSGEESWQEAAPKHSTIALQKAMNEIMNAKLVVDGKAGPATEKAVRDFQASHGLKEDGIAGPVTRAAIEVALKDSKSPR